MRLITLAARFAAPRASISRSTRGLRAFTTATAQLSNQAPPKDEEIKIEIKLAPIPRPNEPTEKKRARLLYQSRKRGILETDLLLSRFAHQYLQSMTRPELDEYDKMLDEQDWDLYYWATDSDSARVPCPEHWQKSEVFQKLKQLARNDKREVLRMPELS